MTVRQLLKLYPYNVRKQSDNVLTARILIGK